MKSIRQLALAVLLALLFSSIVLGSISLSYVESGYVLAQAGTPGVFYQMPGLDDLVLRGRAQEKPGEEEAAAQPQSNTGSAEAQPIPCQSIPAGWTELTLTQDDTLGNIARRYSISLEALKSGNCLLIERVQPGSVIYVPTLPVAHVIPTTARPVCYPRQGWIGYSVRPGDSLYSLALRLGVAASEILTANCLTSSGLRVGQQILLPYYPPMPATPIPPMSPAPTMPPSITATVPVTPMATAYLPSPTPVTPVPATTMPPIIIIPSATTPPPTTELPPTTVPAPTTEPPTTEPPPTTVPAPTTEPPATEPPTTEPPPNTEPPPATEPPPGGSGPETQTSPQATVPVMPTPVPPTQPPPDVPTQPPAPVVTTPPPQDSPLPTGISNPSP